MKRVSGWVQVAMSSSSRSPSPVALQLPIDLHFWSTADESSSSESLKQTRCVTGLKPGTIRKVTIEGSFSDSIGPRLLGKLLRNLGRLQPEVLVLDQVCLDPDDLGSLFEDSSSSLDTVTLQRIRFCNESRENIKHLAYSLGLCRGLKRFTWTGFAGSQSVFWLRPCYQLLVESLANVPHVSFRSRIDTISPVSGATFGRLMAASANLHSLELSCFGLSLTDWSALGQGLCDSLACTTLKVRGSVIPVPGALSLISGLRENKTLQVLDLRDSHISISAFRGLIMDYKERDIVWTQLLLLLTYSNQTLHDMRLDCRSFYHGMKDGTARRVRLLLNLNSSRWRGQSLEPTDRLLLSHLLALYADSPPIAYQLLRNNLTSLMEDSSDGIHIAC